MSITVEEDRSPFSDLLNSIGQLLEGEEVRYMKFLLQGHVGKETLEYLDTGPELAEVLRTRGLVSEKRLAFLRKLLIEAKCLKLVHLLDEYKEKFAPGTAVGEKEQNEKTLQQNNKREVLLRMIESVETEMRACEDTEIQLKNAVKDSEFQIKSNNMNLAQIEDDIQVLKSKRIEELESQIESYERKLESARFFIKKQQVEIDKVKAKLDGNPNSATLKMEFKGQNEEYEKKRRGEDELLAKRQEALEGIRTIHVEIRHKTQEAMGIEDHIHGAQMEIRRVKHDLRKNQRTLLDLQEKLESLCVELEATNRQKPFTPFLRARSRMRPSSRMPTAEDNTAQSRTFLEYKLLDYGEITDREATAIGRKGKRSSPPQFNLPTSVAVDRFGRVYVADYGNGRIQILDASGKMARDPLNIGGKCRPCALVVSAHGDLVMTDSQIIRVFSRTGEPLRPILPVYSKSDRRPELSAVALDKQGHIYAADKANHRIQKFSFDGNFLCFIGSSQDLHKPMGVVVTSSGDVIVSEFDTHCLKIFAREGLVHCKTLGARGVGIGKFTHPRGLALDRRENILVADSHNHRIHVISLEGDFVGSFGTIGEDPGCLDTPYDVTVDACGNVIVADTKNHRIQMFTRLVPLYTEPANYDEGNEAQMEDEAEEDGIDEIELQVNDIELNAVAEYRSGEILECNGQSEIQQAEEGSHPSETEQVEKKCTFEKDDELAVPNDENNNTAQHETPMTTREDDAESRS